MNAPAQIRTPYGDQCRKRDRIQAIRDRAYSEWHRILSDMEAEIRKIEREGM